MALVGYASVSLLGQSLDIQLNKLKHCDKIYQETQIGDNQEHSQLAACMEYVRDGDTLVVSRLDRLAKSTLQLSKIADKLQHKNVILQVLDQNIDTSDDTGKLFFNVLAVIAEFETEIFRERQLSGNLGKNNSIVLNIETIPIDLAPILSDLESLVTGIEYRDTDLSVQRIKSYAVENSTMFLKLLEINI